MKIAFWSGIRKEGGVTGNLAAITTLCTLLYGTRFVVSSNHVGILRIQDCFDGTSQYQAGTEKKRDYVCYGEPDYFREVWSMKENRSELADGIYLQHPPDMLEERLFREARVPGCVNVMDVAGKQNLASSQALEEADRIVVFLPQDTERLEQFFEGYASYVPKSLFFINQYRKKRECTPGYISRNYGVKKEKIGIIPYNTAYAEACAMGLAERFLRENLNGSGPNSDFMRRIRRAAEMLHKEMEHYEKYQNKRTDKETVAPAGSGLSDGTDDSGAVRV